MLSISNKKEFRGEIQGLRAIAILGVLIYHSGIELIPGGFVGVDIFFTISGYLITQLILRDLLNNSFKLKNFYMRRIRRLLPSLAVTVIVSCIVVFFIYPPELIVKTYESAIAAIFSFSNIFFFIESGYWDFSAKFKPLLHTWSLGVEEQFYLLYPALIVLLFKKIALHSIAKILSVLFVLSFFISILLTPDYSNLTFYLLPFRMFEFILGGLICFLPKSKKYISPNLAELLVFVSLLSIVLCFLYFTQAIAFPGWWPIIPCLSCAIIIYLRDVQLSQVILANRFSLYIGKISYSLYLVHWPLIVFYTFLSPQKLGLIDSVVLVLISFVLAMILHESIESKLRFGHKREKQFVIFCFFILLMLYYIVNNNGRLFVSGNPVEEVVSLPAKVANLKRHEKWFNQCDTNSFVTPEKCLKPNPKKNNVLIVGDSHGIDGFNILSQAYPQNHYILISEKGCPHLMDTTKNSSTNCKTSYNDIKSYLNKHEKVRYVVYSIKLNHSRLENLVKTVVDLNSLGINVIVMGVGPWYSNQTRIVAHKSESFQVAQNKIDKVLVKKIFKLNDKARHMILDAGAIYIDKLAYFCKQNSCMAFTLDQKEMVTYDRSHLSEGATKDFARFLIKNTHISNIFNEK